MSSRIYLRALEISDCQRIYTWHNDPELYRTLTGTFHFVSTSTVETWLKSKISYSEKEMNFAICRSDSKEHIGNIYLRDIDSVNRNGYLGIFIGNSEYRSKGYAAEAVNMVLEYAFETLGLERICLYLLEDNTTACKLYEKCGFVKEGKLRRHVFKDGQFKDAVFMGICRDDFLSVVRERKNT